MRIPYIRLAKGLPSETAQRRALADAGLTEDELAEAYIEPKRAKPGEPSAWSHVIGTAREIDGERDLVCVARPAIVANSEQDARARLIELTEQGGSLWVASTGRTYRWHPDAAEGIQFSADIHADARAVTLEKARAAIKRSVGNVVHGDNRWTVAAQLWADPNVTAKDAAARSGVGVRHLYRRFGPKGTAPFTGGPRKRGRR